MESTVFEEETLEINNSMAKGKKPKIMDLFSNSTLRKNFIFASFIWTAIVFNFFLLTFYFKYFPGSIFTNSLYFAGADMISYLLSGLIIKYLNTSKAIVLA